MEISRETSIGEIIEKYPDLSEIFLDFGLGCSGCSGSDFETIGDVGVSHMMNDDEIDMLIKDLNEAKNELENKKE